MRTLLETMHLLKRPFPETTISWRVGQTNRKKLERSGKPLEGNLRGRLLAYIDARDVQKRLDELFPLAWMCRYSHVSKEGVVCEISLVLPDGEVITRADGAGENRDIEAEKSAMSDAFKRAASKFGIGTYLYKLKWDNWEDWVEVDQYGNIKGKPPALPAWATPEGYDQLTGKTG